MIEGEVKMLKMKRIATEQHKAGISNGYIYLYDIILSRPTGDDSQPYEANQYYWAVVKRMRHWVA